MTNKGPKDLDILNLTKDSNILSLIKESDIQVTNELSLTLSMSYEKQR